jgi:heme/copper-type cytochrome/quinol oxidase subunit 3
MNIVATIDNVPPLPSASEAGPAPKRIVVGFGFWVFLLSDIVMFSALFAAYAVLVNATAGGPSGAQLFNQTSVAIQTACLLASSYTCGLMSLAIGSRDRLLVMMTQVQIMDFRAAVQRRLLCFSLFWHALDIIWVGLFTLVYLMGVRP